MNEHWKTDKKGNIKGVYHVKANEATGVDVWAKLDMVIKSYSELHPQEMAAQLESNRINRETQKNEYGSAQKLRWGADLPVALLLKLEQVEPNLFIEKKLFNQFLERYKGFNVCRKV